MTTSTSNLSRDERAKIIQEMRAAAAATAPTTPPGEVNGKLSSATNDVTSPFHEDVDDSIGDDDDGIPLATIVEGTDDNDKGHGTKDSSPAASAGAAKDGDEDHYDDDDSNYDDDAEEGRKKGNYDEEEIISDVQKRTTETLPVRAGE